MDLYSIHPHALKHGLSKGEITSAWNQAFAWFRRDLDNGGIDYLLVGVGCNGRLIEMIARYWQSQRGYVIYHAFTPPTQKVLREIGLVR